jgi:hypothetical protein
MHLLVNDELNALQEVAGTCTLLIKISSAVKELVQAIAEESQGIHKS